MNEHELRVQRATEALRQETETFNHNRRNSSIVFAVQIGIAVVATLMLIAVLVAAFWVALVTPAAYSERTVYVAVWMMFGDSTALVAWVWKFVLSLPTVKQLRPVTTVAGEAGPDGENEANEASRAAEPEKKRKRRRLPE